MKGFVISPTLVCLVPMGLRLPDGLSPCFVLVFGEIMKSQIAFFQSLSTMKMLLPTISHTRRDPRNAGDMKCLD